MSRPSPTILNRIRIGKTDYESIIIQGTGHWTVVYDNEPINIIRSYYYGDRKKYVNNGFANEGHAKNLAKKLNAQFGTDKFTVRKLL